MSGRIACDDDEAVLNVTDSQIGVDDEAALSVTDRQIGCPD
ncbi:hypothetical protein ACFVT2_14840 [Streptomyces sp. NPDC058000]